MRMAAGLACLSIVAAACGGGDEAGSGSAGTVDANISGAVNTTAGGATATTAVFDAPASMEEWEALWAEERAAVVQRAKDEGWGKSADGKTVTGPGGFTIDLSKCPAGWSDTEGVTDTSVKIGQAIAQSGTFADYNNYARGINAVFEHYADEGLFTDVNGKKRRIDYVVRDDGYDPARTIPLVDELLDAERAFAVWTLGTPSTMKTYDKLNQRCVPHPEAMTAHPAWGDPVNHPWTTGAPATSYSTEAILWSSFIEERLDEFGDGEVTVAALVMNNDFGKIYEATFRAAIQQSDVLRDRVNFVTETIEAQAPTVKDPMTTLSAENPDVFIAMLAATACTQTVIEAAENGMKESVAYMFQPLTCSGTNFVAKDKVGGDGSASDGWWILNPGAKKDFKDPSQADDPFVAWGRELLESKGIAPDSSSLLGDGVGAYGWVAAQTLAIAGQLPGGLTRTNYVLAQRGIKMTSAYSEGGLTTHMNGNEDSYFIESGVWQVFDSEKQIWVNQGDVIELDGKSQNCGWDQSTSRCNSY